ncbi:MAG: hypothetical protein BWX70_03508 [Verrucomicrobia bacterium ADurb.Bin070]|nr:MAG: hypothetical protein BWX70_03508 [Verrucomicrobia bacterium ADurb.Bin070]
MDAGRERDEAVALLQPAGRDKALGGEALLGRVQRLGGAGKVHLHLLRDARFVGPPCLETEPEIGQAERVVALPRAVSGTCLGIVKRRPAEFDECAPLTHIAGEAVEAGGGIGFVKGQNDGIDVIGIQRGEQGVERKPLHAAVLGELGRQQRFRGRGSP